MCESCASYDMCGFSFWTMIYYYTGYSTVEGSLMIKGLGTQ